MAETETAETEAPEPRYVEAQEFRAADEVEDPYEVAAGRIREVAAVLRDRLIPDGETQPVGRFDGDPEALDTRPVIFNETGDGFIEHVEGAPVDGWVTRWRARVQDAVTDPPPLAGRHTVYEAVVDDQTRAEGGSVRVQHDLDGEVTVEAFDGAGEPIGYHFAQELSDDHVHVDVVPTTAMIRVTRDADQGDDDDG